MLNKPYCHGWSFHCVLIAFVMLLTIRPSEGGAIDPELSSRMDTAPPAREFAVLVKLKKPADQGVTGARNGRETRHIRAAKVVQRLKSEAESSQRDMKSMLERNERSGRARGTTPFWIFNGFAVTAQAATIRELAAHKDVAQVVEDRIFTLAAAPSSSAAATQNWNLSRIGAQLLWSRGFTGQGVVVANLDTGVDIGHAALGSKWRGGSNSWFDPFNGTTVPYDLSGHGTATMGIMVGGNTSDNLVGVAPGARWIAAKIFDDASPPQTTLSKIHQAFQWVLDPDLDPATDDTPDVVNNSWDMDNPGVYDSEFAADIQSLKGAGINVVCVSGNVLLPQPAGTSTSPGNNPGAFPVGATDENDLIAYFSARGPSASDGSFYPALAAPGAAIRSTDLYNTYVSFSGTSFAAPHVAGALALLKSAVPGLSAQDAETALKNSVVTANGPDNSSGYGRMDVAKAYAYLAIPGDANGDGKIDFADAMVALRTCIGLSATNGLIDKNANLSPMGQDGKPLGHSGAVTIQDALLILQRAAGFVSW
jgi:serine protease AprX